MTATKSKLFINSGQTEWEEMAKGLHRQILGFDSELMMVRVMFEKGAVGSLHRHPHRQVSYVESGRFEIQIDDEKVVLEKGDSFFVPPGIQHEAIALEKGCLVDVFNPMR